jgi:hypothetical protein
MDNLLNTLLGTAGLQALETLLKSEDLASFIIPKAVVSWLQKAEYGSLSLDGFDSLKKTGYGYSGTTKVGNLDYVFDKVTEQQVAAIVSVRLEKTMSPLVKEIDLARLSKTIDLLVKAQKPAKIEPVEAKVAVDGPKKPQEPMPPVAPNETVYSNKNVVQKSFMVSEKDSKTKCKLCGKGQFKDNKFSGCVCVRSLAKSVDTKLVGSKYKLTFGNDLGEDEILTIYSLF